MPRCNNCEGDCYPCQDCKAVEARTEVITLEKRIKELENENNLLYHQRDEWKRRADNPKSAWYQQVHTTNWLTIVFYRLRRRIHKLEAHGFQPPEQCCFCDHAVENEIT